MSDRSPIAAVRSALDARTLPARLREGFAEFVHTETAGAVALLLAAVVALVVANSPVGDAYEAFWHTKAAFSAGSFALEQSLVHWVNDALMALFFFVVGLEIRREFLAGELSDRRRAVLPVLAAVGGMIVPALAYLAFNAGGAGQNGWGIPTATDIAFVVGVMALLGDRVPSSLKVFLVALAIADDIGAILVIAIVYTSGVVFSWLACAALMFAALVVLNRLRVDSPLPYFVLGGVLWLAMLFSGVHATIAGVLVAMTVPSTAKVDPLAFTRNTRERLERIEAAHVPGANVLCDDTQQHVAFDIRKDAHHTASPLQRLEFALHPWTTFVVLPLFALANAGVRFTGTDAFGALSTPIGLGVLVGLVVGKPLGITAATWLAVRLRVAALPVGVNWGQLAGAAVLGGIGFTMSLFVADLAFRSTSQTGSAKAAILVASLAAGVLGYVAIRLSSRRLR